MCKPCEDFINRYPLQEVDGEQVHVLEEDMLSDPIRCAFVDGVFQSDNWCCKTMQLLRSICEKWGVTHWHRDSNLGSIGIPVTDEEHDAPDKVQYGFLVMSWYKNRGRTGQAIVMCDEATPEPLTLITAQFILNRMFKERYV